MPTKKELEQEKQFGIDPAKNGKGGEVFYAPVESQSVPEKIRLASPELQAGENSAGAQHAAEQAVEIPGEKPAIIDSERNKSGTVGAETAAAEQNPSGRRLARILNILDGKPPANTDGHNSPNIHSGDETAQFTEELLNGTFEDQRNTNAQ